MANRSLTLTTAAGLALLVALPAAAGQANVSLAEASAPAAASTTTIKEAAVTASIAATLGAQTPPAAAPEPCPKAPSVTGGST